MSNTYETVFICPAEISQEKVESTVEKVKSVISKAEGKITNSELWGRRRLAYPIKRNREGFYVYMVFNALPTVVASLDHHFRVTDAILRGLTVRIDPKHLEKMKPASAPAADGAAAPAAETAAPAASAQEGA